MTGGWRGRVDLFKKKRKILTGGFGHLAEMKPPMHGMQRLTISWYHKKDKNSSLFRVSARLSDAHVNYGDSTVL